MTKTLIENQSSDGSVESEIRKKSFETGFDCIAITHASDNRDLFPRLQSFIDNHYHGSMTWMETRKDERSKPKSLWSEARSVIMLGMNYGPDHNPLTSLENKSRGNISVYAQNNDYHDLIKKKLKIIARWLVDAHGGDVKVFVDTAPVMEKPLAQQAGLGWQGKHTNLVSRDFGSWLFLGSIFTSLTLENAQPGQDHCGSCTNCLDICPTNAFPAPYQLDARRCISYLTIEHKGSIPEEFRKPMGNRIYGCDDCLAVCPWNKYASVTDEPGLQPRDSIRASNLKHYLTFSDQEFRTFFSKSPIKRIGRDRFIRNVLIAAGNSDDKSLCEPIAQHLKDPDETIVETAQWALKQFDFVLPSGHE